MHLSSDQIEAAALQLPAAERERLVEQLIGSLRDEQAARTSELSDAWLEEARRRLEQLRSGEVEALPAVQLTANVRARLT